MNPYRFLTRLDPRSGMMALGVAAWLLLPACGGTSSDDGATCNDREACGGDVVGTWKLDGSCVSLELTDMGMMGTDDCPGLTTELSDFNYSGTVTYNRDGTYQSAGSLSASATLTFPGTCITFEGVKLTCGQLEQIARAQEGIAAVSCSDARDGGCSCKVTSRSESKSSSGTYTTANGLLTLNGGEGHPYCVNGNVMTLTPDAMPSGMSTVSGTVTGYLKLVKQ